MNPYREPAEPEDKPPTIPSGPTWVLLLLAVLVMVGLMLNARKDASIPGPAKLTPWGRP